MEVGEEEQEHVVSLIEMGEKLEAIRYCQQTFNLDAEQAITMVERLEEQVDDKKFKEIGEQVTASTSGLPKMIGRIFGGIGLILIILAVFFGYRTYTFLQKAVPLPGVVKGFREFQVRSTDNDNRTIVSTVVGPILEYKYEGKDYTYESPYGSSTPAYSVGDQIPLLIDPARPSEPDEAGFMDQWFVTLILGAIGLIFFGVGIIVSKSFKNR